MMTDPCVEALRASARSGRMTRRDVLAAGLRFGLATPVILGLMAEAPEAGAAPGPAVRRPWPEHAGNGTTFVYLRDGSSPDIDPHYAYNNAPQSIILGLYEMLIQYKGDATDQYEPMLAESWTASADQSTFTFKLYPNVTFHDGDPCTAHSVHDSFNRLLLQNAGPVAVLQRFMPDPAMMTIVDDLTITFNLGKPQPLFLSAMAASYGPFVINPKYVDLHKTADDPWAHEWFRQNAIGTGPYKLKENSATEQVILEKFDGYHGGWDGVHFTTIICRIVPEITTRRELVESGEADATTENLTPDDVASLKGNAALQVLTYASTNVQWAIMNAPRLKTKEVRQGFSYAFPYDLVVNSAYKGLLKRSGPIASTVRASDPGVFLYQTDLDKAKQLILAGGFKEGDSFDWIFGAGDAYDPIVSQLFQANLETIGFKLNITTMEGGTFTDMVYGNSPAESRPHFIGGWGWWPDYNDPWSQLHPNFAKVSEGGGGSNAGFYENARFEELMAQAEHYTDEAQLTIVMKEAQNILTEQDPAALFYGELSWYTAMRKEIQGFVGNPLYLGSFPFYRMSRTAP